MLERMFQIDGQNFGNPKEPNTRFYYIYSTPAHAVCALLDPTMQAGIVADYAVNGDLNVSYPASALAYLLGDFIAFLGPGRTGNSHYHLVTTSLSPHYHLITIHFIRVYVTKRDVMSW